MPHEPVCAEIERFVILREKNFVAEAKRVIEVFQSFQLAFAVEFAQRERGQFTPRANAADALG